MSWLEEHQVSIRDFKLNRSSITRARERINKLGMLAVISENGAGNQAGVLFRFDYARRFLGYMAVSDPDNYETITAFTGCTEHSKTRLRRQNQAADSLFNQQAQSPIPYWKTITRYDTPEFVYINAAFIEKNWDRLQLTLRAEDVVGLSEVYGHPVWPSIELSAGKYKRLQADWRHRAPYVPADNRSNTKIAKEVNQYDGPVVLAYKDHKRKGFFLPLSCMESLQASGVEIIEIKSGEAAKGNLDISPDKAYLVREMRGSNLTGVFNANPLMILVHGDPSPAIQAVIDDHMAKKVRPFDCGSPDQYRTAPGVKVKSLSSIKTAGVLTGVMKEAIEGRAVARLRISGSRVKEPFTFCVIGHPKVIGAMRTIPMSERVDMGREWRANVFGHLYGMAGFLPILENSSNNGCEAEEKIRTHMKNVRDRLSGIRYNVSANLYPVHRNGDHSSIIGAVTTEPTLISGALRLQETCSPGGP